MSWEKDVVARELHRSHMLDGKRLASSRPDYLTAIEAACREYDAYLEENHRRQKRKKSVFVPVKRTRKAA